MLIAEDSVVCRDVSTFQFVLRTFLIDKDLLFFQKLFFYDQYLIPECLLCLKLLVENTEQRTPTAVSLIGCELSECFEQIFTRFDFSSKMK